MLLSFIAALVSGQPALADVKTAEPYVRPAQEFLVPSAAPYLLLSRFTVDGRSESELAAGETASLAFSVANVGRLGTAGAKVTIDRIEGPAAVVSGEATLPPLAAGEEMDFNEPRLTFEISPSAAPADIVTVSLKWETSEGYAGLVSRSFEVIHGGVAIRATEGEIAPGGSGQLFVRIANTGNEILQDVVLLPSAGECVAAVSGELRIAELAPGEELRVPTPLEVSVPLVCPNGSQGIVSLSGSYQSRGQRLRLSGEATFIAGVLSVTEAEAVGLALPIPDAGPEITQSLVISRAGPVQAIGITVRIVHPYLGDLRIMLQHPDGTRVSLPTQAGGSSTGIDATYGFDGTEVPSLAEFVGKPMQGEWKLVVQDIANADVGTLDAVKLRIRGYAN